MDTQRANASGMSLAQTYEVLCQGRGLDADPFAFLAAQGAVPFDEFMAVLGFDQQWRWARQRGRSAEDYFQNLPQAYQSHAARLQLIEWEIAARKHAGDVPTLAELERRFPDVRDALPGLLTAARSAADSSPPAPASDGVDHANKSAYPTQRTSADTLSTLRPPLGESSSPAMPPSPAQGPGPQPPAVDPLGVVGKSFNARYEVTGYLGSGSFGHVYRGRDGRFDRGDDSALVAIKFMQTSLINRSGFEREAQLMRRFRHHHFVDVYDFGDDATGLSWLVMEFLPGQTLDQVLQQTAGPAPAPLVIQFAEQVLSALHSAHRNHLIHRDLKPANIIVMPEGEQGEVCFKVLDFGLSSQLDASNSLANRTMNGAGTPTFMAPEQITTGLATPRSDLYSVGVMLYWMLSGRMPFELVSVPKALYDAVHTPAPALSSVLAAGTVSPALNQLIARCLAKDPAARPPDLLVVRDGLLDAMRSWKVKASPKPTGATAEPRRPQNARKSRAVAVVALVGLFAMAAAGLYPGIIDAWKLARQPMPNSATTRSAPPSSAPISSPLVATSAPAPAASSSDKIPEATSTTPATIEPTPVPTATGDTADRPDASPSPAATPPPPVALALKDPPLDDPKIPMPAPPPQVVVAARIGSEDAPRPGRVTNDDDQKPVSVKPTLPERDDKALIEARDDYIRGVEFQSQGRLDEAIAAFDSAISRDPKLAAAYGNRGNARQTRHDFENAIADYNELIRLEPENALAHNNRGNAWRLQGNNDKALADFNEAIRLDPKLALAYSNRGIIRRTLGDLEGAIENYNEAIRLDPTRADAFNNRGNVWRETRKFEKAIEDYTEAVRVDPKFVMAFINRGIAWREQGDVPKAIADLKEALRLDPQNTVARDELAETLALPPDTSAIKATSPAAVTIAGALREGTQAGQVWEGNGLKIKFRWCPPGSFMMGSPQSEAGHKDDANQVSVTLTRGFWLGETEVTQGQWQAVMGTAPWKGEALVREGPSYPATFISQGDAGEGELEQNSALDFCRRWTDQERKAGRLPAGWKYALPTEAEWEYGCRAGTATAYSFGNDASELSDEGWHDKNALDIGEMHAHEVGLKKPNAWGLLDMHGNVFEWCRDWYVATLTGGTDSVGPAMGSYRVIRGGGWSSKPVEARASSRGGGAPGHRFNFLGFRLALVPAGPAKPAEVIDAGALREGTQAGQAWDANGLKIRFRWCPAGSFTMGSPKSEVGRGDDEKQVSVALTRGFWLGETEVTQGQWQAVMGTAPWKGKEFVKVGPNYPATYISHGDAGDGTLEPDSASEFCRRLTDQEGASGQLSGDWKYALPTEAQWEYACRAGTTTAYSFGNDASKLSEYGWYDKYALVDGEMHARPVGLKKPNAWGLVDMHGNVWEWCRDRYASTLAGGNDPGGPPTGSLRVDRGGGWNYFAVNARSSYRSNGSPGSRHYFVGFRVALVPAGQ